MLPHVMRFNANEAEVKYVEAVRLMGFRAESAQDAADALTRFSEDLGLPIRLREAGVSEDSLSEMAEDASGDVSLFNNPVKCSKEDLLDLYRRAL